MSGWHKLPEDVQAHVLSFVKGDRSHGAAQPYASSRRVCKAWSIALPKVDTVLVYEKLMSKNLMSVVAYRIYRVVLNREDGVCMPTSRLSWNSLILPGPASPLRFCFENDLACACGCVTCHSCAAIR